MSIDKITPVSRVNTAMKVYRKQSDTQDLKRFKDILEKEINKTDNRYENKKI